MFRFLASIFSWVWSIFSATDPDAGPSLYGKLKNSEDATYIPFSDYTAGNPVIATEAKLQAYAVPLAGGVMTGLLTIVPGVNGTKAWLGMYNAGSGHTNAPTALDSTSQYLKIGGKEYGANTYRGIGFGYVGGPTEVAPGFVGYQEKNTSGGTNGDVVIATRLGTSGNLGVRLRVTTAGDIQGEGSYAPANAQSLTTKAYVDARSLTPDAVTAIKALTASSTVAEVIAALQKA